jgi:subtilisin family serine protease
MINPWLEQRLFELPVRPLLIEAELGEAPQVARFFTREGIEPRSVNQLFSLIATPPIPAKWVRGISDIPGVRSVHADQEFHILPGPLAEDPAQWWPTSDSRRLLEAHLAFEAGFTGENMSVAVIDTGVDPNHEQLAGTEFDSTIMVPREPGIDAGPQASGHGSHVASTVAGRQQLTPLQVFVEGVARAPMLSVQCLGRVVGTGFTHEIVNAITLAFERGVRIFNLSLGAQECQGTCENCPECRVIRTLTRRGAIFVIAAGNSGPNPNTVACPGCVPEAITVAAIDRRGEVARFSSRGGVRFPGKPDVAAPGVNIYSGTGRASQIDLGDPGAGVGYAAISGTSMAAPHVAGLVALLKQRDPALTAQDFKNVMRRRGGHNPNTGWGVPSWSMYMEAQSGIGNRNGNTGPRYRISPSQSRAGR